MRALADARGYRTPNVDTQISSAASAMRDESDAQLAASPSLLTALSVANAVGFMPSTVMPVWVGHLQAPTHGPAWYGGAIASLQLASLTAGNLTAEWTIGSLSPRRIAPIAAGFVAAGFLLMGCSMPVAVISGAVLSGGACGWLLASANSVAACLARPQQAFALLQIVLVALGIVLFFTL